MKETSACASQRKNFGSGLLLLVAVWLGCPVMASAQTTHAHHHYQMGIRAYAGSRHAAILHHQAAQNKLLRSLALDNVSEMKTLAEKLVFYAKLISQIQSKAEQKAIGKELSDMRALGKDALQRSEVLWKLLHGATAEFASPTDCRKIQEKAATVFARFQELLLIHKRAEGTLGIVAAPEPKLPASAPTP